MQGTESLQVTCKRERARACQQCYASICIHHPKRPWQIHSACPHQYHAYRMRQQWQQQQLAWPSRTSVCRWLHPPQMCLPQTRPPLLPGPLATLHASAGAAPAGRRRHPPKALPLRLQRGAVLQHQPPAVPQALPPQARPMLPRQSRLLPLRAQLPLPTSQLQVSQTQAGWQKSHSLLGWHPAPACKGGATGGRERGGGARSESGRPPASRYGLSRAMRSLHGALPHPNTREARQRRELRPASCEGRCPLGRRAAIAPGCAAKQFAVNLPLP